MVYGLSLTLVLLILVIVVSSSPALHFRSEQDTPKPPVEDKVWLFAVDGLKRPYSFVNDTGSLVGFDVDLISAVCKLAGKRCDMVLAAFTECAFTSRDMNYPGRGLMAGWFDACPSYAITVDRLATFDFTDPYITTVATFSVEPGNPSGFDPTADDYSAFNLTHLTGAPTNAACLNRLQKKFGNIIIAKDRPDAKALLDSGVAQALFSPRTKIAGLDVLTNTIYHCDEGGAGVLVKKGSTLPSWWNPAFKKFYDSGDYSNLCQSDQAKFGYPIRCLDPPTGLQPDQ